MQCSVRKFRSFPWVLALSLFIAPLSLSAEPAADKAEIHTVTAGETFYRISLKVYSDEERGRGATWFAIYEHNVELGFIKYKKNPIVLGPYGLTVHIVVNQKLAIPHYSDFFPTPESITSRFGVRAMDGSIVAGFKPEPVHVALIPAPIPVSQPKVQEVVAIAPVPVGPVASLEPAIEEKVAPADTPLVEAAEANPSTEALVAEALSDDPAEAEEAAAEAPPSEITAESTPEDPSLEMAAESTPEDPASEMAVESAQEEPSAEMVAETPELPPDTLAEETEAAPDSEVTAAPEDLPTEMATEAQESPADALAEETQAAPDSEVPAAEALSEAPAAEVAVETPAMVVPAAPDGSTVRTAGPITEKVVLTRDGIKLPTRYQKPIFAGLSAGFGSGAISFSDQVGFRLTPGARVYFVEPVPSLGVFAGADFVYQVASAKSHTMSDYYLNLNGGVDFFPFDRLLPVPVLKQLAFFGLVNLGAGYTRDAITGGRENGSVGYLLSPVFGATYPLGPVELDLGFGYQAILIGSKVKGIGFFTLGTRYVFSKEAR